MKYFVPLIALLLALSLAACDSGVTPDTAAPEMAAGDDFAFSKKDKELVCHVGNEKVGDATYLDDPDCEPVVCTLGDSECIPRVCPDYGKIDLISVSGNALKRQHSFDCDPHSDEQPNECHCADGVCDFDPTDPPWPVDPALGDEDSDGDGIDDGCDKCPYEYAETEDGCPLVQAECACWDELAVGSGDVCSSSGPNDQVLGVNEGGNEIAFYEVEITPSQGFCQTLIDGAYNVTVQAWTSPDPAFLACLDDLKRRCT